MARPGFPGRVKSGVNGRRKAGQRGRRPLLQFRHKRVLQRERSAFYGSNGAGVRCPWRFANLNDTAHAGLAAENGNNAPSTLNWNDAPRLSTAGKRYLFIPAED